jgi:hypothetical protein
MRKFVVTGVLAALGVGLLATPASGSFDHHFSVIAKQTSGHEGHNGFRFQDKLLDPRNRHDKVGRDWGQCTFRPKARKLKCRALIHLNGELGGFGNIGVSGNLGRHDNRVNVVGGTHDFNGVAGKMLLHHLHGNTDRLHFDLVR